MSPAVIDYRDNFFLPSAVSSLRHSHHNHQFFLRTIKISNFYHVLVCLCQLSIQPLKINISSQTSHFKLVGVYKFIAPNTICIFVQFSLLSFPPSTPAVPVFPLSLCSQSHCSLQSLCPPTIPVSLMSHRANCPCCSCAATVPVPPLYLFMGILAVLVINS